MLCASILREKRYELLDKLLTYHRTQTPEYDYPLVPSSLVEILDAFRLLRESPRLDYDVDNYYPLMDVKGISEGVAQGSIRRYLTFLYVRIFSNIGRMESSYTTYTDTVGALKRMDDDVAYMQRTLRYHLDNIDLMGILSFSNIAQSEKKMQTVLEYVRNEIVSKVKEIRQYKPNDADLVQENLREANELIGRKMSDYSLFISRPLETEGIKTFYISGNNSYLFPNEAFQHDSGISYVDMPESVAGATISNIQHGFATIFYMKDQKRLRIDSKDLFAALDRLALDNSLVIVAFDIYLDYYLHVGIKGLEKKDGQYKYNGTPIIRLHGGPSDLVSRTLFVIKREDIPSVTFIPPVKEHIKKYELSLIEDSYYQAYGSIVQLSKHEELLEDVKNLDTEEAKKHSLFNVFVNAKVGVKQSAPVVSIKQINNLRDNGTTDSLDKIKPFSEMFAKPVTE